MKSLYNKYEGKTIALVGSGPTALSFNEEEDVAIAINGAIQLDKHFNYLCMFDTSLPQKTWFYDKPEVQRLVGSELAGMYSIDSSTCVFQYEGARKEPTFDTNLKVFSSVNNIAVCAIEIAIIMGASVINIYGIDMAPGGAYFYGGGKGSYGNTTVEYINKLIELCWHEGVIVNVYGSEACLLKEYTGTLVPEKQVIPNKKFLIEHDRYQYQVTCNGYVAKLMVPMNAPWSKRDKAIVLQAAKNTLGSGYVIEIEENIEPLFKEEEITEVSIIDATLETEEELQPLFND